MRVADYVMEFFQARGIHDVFLLPGGGSMYLVDAVGRAKDIRFTVCQHEQACTIAAEAYARTTTKPGVAIVTTGPGGTNAITGLCGSWVDSIPMFVISGQVKRADMMRGTGLRQRGVQEIDITSIVQPITKYAVIVDEPEQIRFELEKAWHIAHEGRPGPVWLDIPLDVQGAPIDPDALIGYEPPPVSETDERKLADQVSEIIDLLNRSERPLILAGQAIRLSGAAPVFQELYRRFNLPVATTWHALDLIASDDELYAGRPGTVATRASNFIVQNCDLLIAIGTRLDNIITAYSMERFARGARKVVIDIDPAELAKNEASIDLPICAKVGDVLRHWMVQGNRVEARDRTAWFDSIHGWLKRYPVLDGQPFASDGPIGHYEISVILSEEIPAEYLTVFGSSGLSVEALFTSFKNKHNQRVFCVGASFGAMGCGLPAAVGACVGNNRQPVVCVEGDGSLQLNLQEFSTIKAMQLPIKLFVYNNNGYASIRATQRNYFNSNWVGVDTTSGLATPDLGALVKSFGIEAVRISDRDQIRPTIRRVLDYPGPIVCEIDVAFDEVLWPKSSAILKPDGSIVSMPLEDMSPLLSRAELRENMLIPLTKESEQIQD